MSPHPFPAKNMPFFVSPMVLHCFVFLGAMQDYQVANCSSANPWYQHAEPDIMVWYLHNSGHQAVMIMRNREWIPVVYDGLGQMPTEPIIDCAKSLCTFLGGSLGPDQTLVFYSLLMSSWFVDLIVDV